MGEAGGQEKSDNKAAPARTAKSNSEPATTPDLTKSPTLYVVGYAHLDTEWRWEYPQVIREYLSKTLRSNFALFEKYPHYIFNFTGANRYRLMKEYFPEDFAKLKRYVDQGRWFPAGSSMEEGDVNAPNAEAIIRALAPVIPERDTAGRNKQLCSLTTCIDPGTGEKYVDIGCRFLMATGSTPPTRAP